MEPDPGKFAGKDSSSLKSRIEILEKENLALKRSLYDLSLKFNQISSKVSSLGGNIPFFCEDYGPLYSDIGDTTHTNARTNLYGESAELHHKNEKVNIVFKSELKGHVGAVYDVEFSSSGKFIASGSFDKTVRIWNGQAPYKELYCLRDHTLNVSDLCWSKCSTELLSGSYDNTCKIWDLNNGKVAFSCAASGLVQCVMFSSSDKNLFFAGASRNDLLVLDRRVCKEVQKIKCSAMINSLASHDIYLTSANSTGFIEMWDTRSMTKLLSQLNEPIRSTISDINLCKSASDRQEAHHPKYLSVNGYDNVLRIYLMETCSQGKPSLRLTHALKGHKNKNWPIKSCFISSSQFGQKGLETLNNDIKIDEYESESKMQTSTDCLYIATGSADPFVYLYSIDENQNSGALVKKLEGHTDKVYATDIHPYELTICSCSADSTLKIWSVSHARK